MARTTRSSKATSSDAKGSAKPESTASKYVLQPQPENPSKLFILPTKATPEARIVTLPNPRHAKPSRYLVCPETGIYEFTQVAAPKTTPRSWLIERAAQSTEETTKENDEKPNAEVSMGAELFLATAIDPLFLVLPALAEIKTSKGSDEQKRMFLSSEDHFDKLSEEASHLPEILRCEQTRKLVESRMTAVCDTVDAGDESMFRLNEKKLLNTILEKANRMTTKGLPTSMEEKFVKKALEAPILFQKSESTGVEKLSISDSVESNVSTPKTESNESQSTTDTAASQVTTAATSAAEGPVADSIVKALEASPKIVNLQRLKVAFDFICSSYIAATLAKRLSDIVTEESNTDFTPLTEYLTKLANLRADALSSRSMDDYSRKHARDEEEDEARAEKRRKQEEEKKKKATESRGIKQLKKVNTTGMKKMSDFFKKK